MRFPAGRERAPIGQRQEILHVPLEHLQAVFGEAQIADDLGVQQADRVARGGIAKAGVELLGYRCAAGDGTALEDANGEARFGEVAGAGAPPTMTTSKLLLMLDLDIFTVYKSSALILL